MTLFAYKALDGESSERAGTIEAVNMDLAIGALQRRGLIISQIDVAADAKSAFSGRIAIFDRITNEDVVMLSRQMTTLFEAQVSALRAFRLLAEEARTPKLAEKLLLVSNDIQGGSTISSALAKHPDVFSTFYVNMIRAGEESGKLDETFSYLAGYLDRNFEMVQKARNALIYPAFVIITFIVVMILMMTLVVPHLTDMLSSSGTEVPFFTKIIIGLSGFMSRYIVFIILAPIVVGGFLFNYSRSENGAKVVARARLQIPAVGNIYKKIYLSRITDNLSTMLKSGIQILRGLEITGSVVDDPVYEAILTQTASDVKAGMPLSDALRKHSEIPGMVVAMIKIGEETGNMSSILETIARFYRREVDNAVDTLVDLIEPVMIVTLAIGVGILLTAVLMPIYNVASSF